MIVYPKDESIQWQRAICAKELVHVFDKQVFRTQTPEMIEQLAEKIVSASYGNGESPADLVATIDRFAEYQWMSLLFPAAARRLAREKLSRKEITIEEIADWVMIPEQYVRLVLDESWEKISEHLMSFTSGEKHDH